MTVPNFIPLSELMVRGRTPDTVVAIDQNKHPITWDRFSADVSNVSLNFSGRSAPHDTILACDDLYNFAVGFMASCAAEKDIIIAPNLRPNTLQDIAQESGGVIINDNDIQKLTSQPAKHHRFAAMDHAKSNFTLYTSGSTGSPSLIKKSIASLEAEARTAHTLWGDKARHGIFGSSVAHYHAYGLLFQFAWPLCAGIPITTERLNYPESLTNYKERPLNFISSPAFLLRYSNSPTFGDTSCALNFIISAGSPLSTEVAQAIASRFPEPIVEIYGSSETGMIATRNPLDDQEWSPLPEVCIKTDEMHKALICSPYTGADAWIKVQDEIILAQSGRFILNGRNDRIVKIHEMRVSLEQMERACCQTNLISVAKVLKLGNDAHLGCVAKLNENGRKILMDEGKAALVHRLKTHLRASFDLVLLPRKWRFVEEFPQNDMGKILQNDLLSLFEKH